jgi:hypothetical protein
VLIQKSELQCVSLFDTPVTKDRSETKIVPTQQSNHPFFSYFDIATRMNTLIEVSLIHTYLFDLRNDYKYKNIYDFKQGF